MAAEESRRSVLVQLHWQDRSDLRRTELVAQCEYPEVEDVSAWAAEIIERRKAECPEGWTPMVCTQDSEHFVWAAPHQSNKGKSP